MIEIILGSVGSGKTAFAVREMFLNKGGRKTYSNIVTKLKNQIDINPEMIIKKEIVDYKKNRKTGTEEPVFNHSLNLDYWKSINEPINVVLDEAHQIINSRRAMSKINIIITEWLSLIRRVLGQADSGYGKLVMISQLSNRIDIIARDMATLIIYCVCHYKKTCRKCKSVWNEHSEIPEPKEECPVCKSWKIYKHNHILEIFKFKNMEYYEIWKTTAQRSFFRHYYILDIEKYFKYYDTLQWDNLFSAYY